MKQEHKELLLKDLCARLPYGVKILTIETWTNTLNTVEVLKEIFIPEDNIPRCNDGGVPIENIKPYLFPLSSMTEEQRKEYENITIKDGILTVWTTDTYDWLNKNYFDYRGLIGKGIAIDATNLNIY